MALCFMEVADPAVLKSAGSLFAGLIKFVPTTEIPPKPAFYRCGAPVTCFPLTESRNWINIGRFAGVAQR